MKQEKKKRGHLICLDLDNTIVNSALAHIRCYQKAFKELGHPKITQKELMKYFGIPSRIYLPKLIPGLTESGLNKIRKRHDAHLNDNPKYIHFVKGALGALKKLKKDHTLALVTNCNNTNIKIILNAVNISPSFFDVVVGNTPSVEAKPAPDEIIKAERLTHLKADYMVGDTIYDIIAARKAKVKGIGVLSGNHTRAMMKKEGAYAVIKSIKDLPEFVRKDSIRRRG